MTCGAWTAVGQVGPLPWAPAAEPWRRVRRRRRQRRDWRLERDAPGAGRHAELALRGGRGRLPTTTWRPRSWREAAAASDPLTHPHHCLLSPRRAVGRASNTYTTPLPLSTAQYTPAQSCMVSHAYQTSGRRTLPLRGWGSRSAAVKQDGVALDEGADAGSGISTLRRPQHQH